MMTTMIFLFCFLKTWHLFEFLCDGKLICTPAAKLAMFLAWETTIFSMANSYNLPSYSSRGVMVNFQPFFYLGYIQYAVFALALFTAWTMVIPVLLDHNFHNQINNSNFNRNHSYTATLSNLLRHGITYICIYIILYNTFPYTLCKLVAMAKNPDTS